ncbi:MAG TPA: succinate dehydrogenase cytochrome b subunit [Saprospiraceae bacterium]|jgi:succinate dehydrogenase / fumarate reductase cytochrome b subunit|nr:succinate dehydrogenase cytochrome b subunit [Saprospiraceae bacterium]HPI06155.1 succinate dehydrogenase cytochrome b subunit [Saprospiraceae bacterium]
MSWFSKFLSSSIGQKVIMSLTGIFLMLFLIVHLLGNFQLLKDDGGEAFNTYAFFMTHNPLIKIISYSLYAFILWHAVQGIRLWQNNKAARGNIKYAVAHARPGERNARNMAWFGIVIFVFIILHMWQFWLQMKMGVLPPVEVEAYDHPVTNLYIPVAEAFQNLGYVIFYVICMVVIGLHLWHGFWSSFQTLGINHPRYTPLITVVGYIYAVGVPLGFAIIPVWMYLMG